MYIYTRIMVRVPWIKSESWILFQEGGESEEVRYLVSVLYYLFELCGIPLLILSAKDGKRAVGWSGMRWEPIKITFAGKLFVNGINLPIFEESEEHEIAGDIPEPFSPSGNADSKTRSLLRTFVRFRMQILEARWLAGWLAGWLASVSSTLYRAIVTHTHFPI